MALAAVIPIPAPLPSRTAPIAALVTCAEAVPEGEVCEAGFAPPALPIASATAFNFAPVERRAAGSVAGRGAVIPLGTKKVATVILAVAPTSMGFGVPLGAGAAAVLAVRFRAIIAIARRVPGFAAGCAEAAAAVFAPASARIAPSALAPAVVIAITVALRVVPPTIIVWHGRRPSAQSEKRPSLARQPPGERDGPERVPFSRR
jgi:hypothetical protein